MTTSHWTKRLLATAAMATVAIGLLGATPAARADNDDNWRHNDCRDRDCGRWDGNRNWNHHDDWRDRDDRYYYHSTPYYAYPPPAHYGPPAIGFGFRF